MSAIRKRIVIDDRGRPLEVIISWAQFREMSEALGLDLDKSAKWDLRATRRDLKSGKRSAFKPLSAIEEQMAKLVVHHRAARYIKGMDARIKAQLKTKLEELAGNPGAMPGVKPMAGEWAGFYRLRHGDLRVIFLHNTKSDEIVIAHVGPRGDIYK